MQASNKGANKLTGMARDIEKQRYEIREPGSYARVQQARLEDEKRRRAKFKEGTRKFLELKGG